MAIRALPPGLLNVLTRDAYLLFLTRFVRLFAYGSLSVVLVFYLIGVGLRESQTGILLTLTLIGDTVISLYLTTRADRMGRRRMLIVGAMLMAAAGLAFACTSNLGFLIIAGTIGVISPSGNEVGPFLSIEQAALAHVVPDRSRTEVFAWYTLAGSVATATGALFAGAITGALALSNKKSAEQGCVAGQCPPATWSDVDRMNTYASISTVSFVFAGLGVACGVTTLVLTRPSAAAGATSSRVVRISAAPNGFVVRGDF